MFSLQNIKKVAYPREHGSWGFFLEPISLSLLTHFSIEGIILGLIVFFLFLANQPSSIILKRKPRYLMSYAAFFFLLYFLLVLLMLYYFVEMHKETFILIPFFTAFLLMILYKILELLDQNRKVIVELIPQVALALFAISITSFCRIEIEYLIAFFFVLISRSFQTVFYINGKLKFIKNSQPNFIIIHLVGFSFLFILIFLAVMELSPWLSVVSIIILIFRAFIGFNRNGRNEKVKIIGIKEFIYGFLFVIINSIGYIWNI